MKQSANRKRRHRSVLFENSECIYCGGVAVTIEHMPPLVLFDHKQRPKGLEFPACKGCNNGTQAADNAVAVLARAMHNSNADYAAPDLAKVMRGAQNNLAPLLEEMRATTLHHQIWAAVAGVQGARALNIGPIMRGYAAVFFAKLGMALWRSETGCRLPDAGAVRSCWFTNVDRLVYQIPEVAFTHLGEFRTLQQGARNVAGQFDYSLAMTEAKTAAKIVATFRFSFMAVIFVASDANFFDGREFIESEVRPGGLVAKMPAVP